MGTVKGSPTISIRLFVGYGLQLTLRLFVVGGACLDLPKHECTHETHHSRTTIKLKTSEALPHRRSASVYTDQNESRHGEVIPTSVYSDQNESRHREGVRTAKHRDSLARNSRRRSASVYSEQNESTAE